MTIFRHLHRAFSDAVDAAMFRPGKVRRIDDHTGPWITAAVMCFIGAVASTQRDFPEAGLLVAVAGGAVMLAVLAYWSRMNDEALQRSYIGAGLCGVFGTLYAITPSLVMRIATIVWLASAWLVYLRSRSTTPAS